LQFPDQTVCRHDSGGTRASSLNAGASEAQTDWLIFLDADDELAPGYVGAMKRALEQHRGDGKVLFTPAVQVIRKGRPGTPVFFDRGISLRDDNWLIVGTMIHRDLFNEVGGFDDYPHGFEDWALWSKCFRVGARVVKVKDAVYRYHHNPQSAHKQMWRDRKWQVATHMRVKAELDAWEAAL
jgi:glycosyltransferase involved in cell wall biosynthesis